MAKRPSSSGGRIVSHPAARTIVIRQIHAYLSVFVAPTILFFAFTGALQLFSLHEAHGDYRPPALIEKLGMLHREQKFAMKEHHNPAPTPRGPVVALQGGRGEGDWVGPAKAADSDMDDDTPTPSQQILRILFFAAAAVLIVSTGLGLWMAFTQNRQKGILVLVFLVGAAAPVAVLVLL